MADDKKIEELFKKLDFDKKGKVDLFEMMTNTDLLALFGMDTSIAKLKAAIKKFDGEQGNGDGQLDLTEFKNFVKSSNELFNSDGYKEIVNIFQTADKDGNGRITLTDVLESKEKFSKKFAPEELKTIFENCKPIPSITLMQFAAAYTKSFPQ